MSVEKLKDFLTAHFASLVLDGRWMVPISFPEFDLNAFDYLDFAERSLSGQDESDKINCVTNLKRAAECQLDTFLHVMNLSPKREARSFPRKLESIRPFGFLSMRSLAKLNRIRNQLEHDYVIPEDVDIELYFELVSAFVYALEGFVLLLHGYNDVEWAHRESETSMRMRYRFSEPSLEFLLRDSGQGIEQALQFLPESIAEWNEAVRLLFLLARGADTVSADFVLERLNSRERSSETLCRR